MLNLGAAASDLGYVQVRSADFLMSQAETPPSQAEAWSPVALPDQWFKDQRWEQGLQGWYRIRLPDGAPAALQAVYIQRLSVNAAVYFNNQYLGSGGSFEEPVSRNMHRPLFFTLPDSAWRETNNFLHIKLRTYPGYAHLAALRVGDHAALIERYEQQYFVQVSLSQVFYTIVTLAALFSLGFWLFVERHPCNLYLSLTAFSWSVYCLNLFLRDVPISAKFWWSFIHANVEWAGVFLLLFVHRLLELQRRWLELGAVAFALVATATYFSIPLVEINPTARMFHAALLALVAYLVLLSAWHYYRHRNNEALLITGCLLVVGVLGFNDMVRQTVPVEDPDWETPFYLLQFGAPMMFLVLVGHIVARYTQSQKRLAVAMVEQDIARQQERERIFQDLHDDVGAKLLTLVYRSQDRDAQDLARSALQDMREIISGDLAQQANLSALLDMLQAEANARCSDVNVPLEMRVDVPMDQLTYGEFAYHFSKIFRELISNSLRHATNPEIHVTLQVEHEQLVMRYSDGQPWPIEQSDGGRGWPGIRRRCRLIDATFTWLDRADGYGCEFRFQQWQDQSSDES